MSRAELRFDPRLLEDMLGLGPSLRIRSALMDALKEEVVLILDGDRLAVGIDPAPPVVGRFTEHTGEDGVVDFIQVTWMQGGEVVGIAELPPRRRRPPGGGGT